MSMVSEGFPEVPKLDLYERGIRMGRHIGNLNISQPLSDDPLRDALEEGAYAAAALSGHARDAAEVDALVHGTIDGIQSRFDEQVVGEESNV